MSGQAWAESERRVLRLGLRTTSYAGLVKLLPGRSVQAIKMYARKRRWHTLTPYVEPKLLGSQSASAKELAYIAGFLDGEGCFSLVPRKKGGKVNGYFVRVNVVNTNRAIIVWMREIFGGNLYMRKRQKKNHKVAWSLTLSEVQAGALLRRVLPYLRVKQQQAKLLLAYRESVVACYHYPDRLGLPVRIQTERDRMYREIRRLNRKGIQAA